jgi:hypothetical protein
MNEKNAQSELTEPQIRILKTLATVESFGLYCLSQGRPLPTPLQGMLQHRLCFEVRKLTELELCCTDDLDNVSIHAAGRAWLDANAPAENP